MIRWKLYQRNGAATCKKTLASSMPAERVLPLELTHPAGGRARVLPAELCGVTATAANGKEETFPDLHHIKSSALCGKPQKIAPLELIPKGIIQEDVAFGVLHEKPEGGVRVRSTRKTKRAANVAPDCEACTEHTSVKDESACLDEAMCAAWAKKLRRFGRATLWAEKARLLFDSVQCFGVVWECSQAWPWPSNWLAWTRWAVVINADVPALGSKGAGMGATGELDRSVYGQMPNFLSRLALPVVSVAASLVCLNLLLRTSTVRTRAVERGMSYPRIVASSCCTRLASALYVPCGMVLARLFQCGYLPASHHEGLRLSVDPSYKCLGRTPVFARVSLAPVAVMFLAALPWLYSEWTEKACEFESEIDHEKSVQSTEIEHVLEIDAGDPEVLSLPGSTYGMTKVTAIGGPSESEYNAADAWLCASFRRHAVAHDAHTMTRKVCLLICFGALFRATRSQGLAIFAIALVFAVPNLARPPYRHASSNAVLLATELATVTTSVYAMLTAWGLRSASVMPRQQTFALVAVNVAASISVLGAFAFTLFEEPKAEASFKRAVQLHSATTVVAWIESARVARAAAIHCRAWRPLESVPVHRLEEHMAHVRNCWLDAKRRDSLLELTLRKSLDELILAHQAVAADAMRLDRVWLSEHDNFKDVSPGALRQRADDLSLLQPSKRVLLTKLLALRQFQASLARASKRRASCAANARLIIRDPDANLEPQQARGVEECEVPIMPKLPCPPEYSSPQVRKHARAAEPAPAAAVEAALGEAPVPAAFSVDETSPIMSHPSVVNSYYDLSHDSSHHAASPCREVETKTPPYRQEGAA